MTYFAPRDIRIHMLLIFDLLELKKIKKKKQDFYLENTSTFNKSKWTWYVCTIMHLYKYKFNDYDSLFFFWNCILQILL